MSDEVGKLYQAQGKDHPERVVRVTGVQPTLDGNPRSDMIIVEPHGYTGRHRKISRKFFEAHYAPFAGAAEAKISELAVAQTAELDGPKFPGVPTAEPETVVLDEAQAVKEMMPF